MQPAPPRWQTLRTISTILRVLAWIVVGVGIFAVIIAFCSGTSPQATPRIFKLVGFQAVGAESSVIYALVLAVNFGAAFLALLGASELILLFIAIEENTRHSSVATPPLPPPAPTYMPPPPQQFSTPGQVQAPPTIPPYPQQPPTYQPPQA